MALVFGAAFMMVLALSSQVAKAEYIENGYYKQSFYFEDLSGQKHLIATHYVKEGEDEYSYLYDKDGKTTKLDGDEAINKAYEKWVEGTYKLHYFNALRFTDKGDKQIQRVGVDINRKAYALYYKCVNTQETVEDEADFISSSNTFGYQRRLYKKNDTMVYCWVAQEGEKGVDILSQLGPNSLDELDENKQTTTAAPATEKPTVKEVKLGKAVVKSVKKKKSAKKITIKLGKVNDADGYEVQISKKKNFKKTLFKKKTSKLTYTLTHKKLKKIVVYVRARAYKEVDGVNKTGAWSSVKKSK